MGNHADFTASIVRFIGDGVQKLKQAGTLPADAGYYDFEAMANASDIPMADQVGMMNLHWSNDGTFYDVGFSLGVATWQDTSLFRHRDVVDYFETILRPEAQIPLLDARTGVESGWLAVLPGVSLMPMMKTETRPLQFMLVPLKASRTT